MKMLCFRVTVPTTNPSKDTFSIDGAYHTCQRGEVFVFAESIADAAKMLPMAEAIDVIGFGYSPDPR